MDPLVRKVVDTGISKGVDFDKIASAMYNSGAGENQVLQAQEYYNQVKKKSPSVAGVSPSISGRTPSSLELAPVKVKGQGDPNDPSGLYGQVEEANRRINTANRIYNVLSKKGDLSPKEIESARKDYQEYRSFYPNLPIDPSEDVGLLTDNIARDRTNIKAKSQPDESNYRRFMDHVYQSSPGGENGFLATILRGTEKVASDIVSLGGAINDATDAFYSSVFGEETAENYKKTFKDTPLEAGAISRFGKGMAEQWNENTKKIAGNWGMTEEQYEKGPGEALLEGDFSTAGKGIAIGLLHTMPELVATAVGLRLAKGAALAGEAITANLISKGTPKWIAGAAGRARAMAPTTLPLYTGANYAEVLDDPEFTTGEKLLYAVGSAVGSTLAESVGGFGEYFLGGAAKKQAVDQVKSSIMQSIGRGTVDMLKAAGVEGAEEVLDGGIQQALGIALGGKKFDASSLLDGFLIGATTGGGTNLISKSPSLIGLSSDMLTTIKITDELSKIQGALSDPSLSDVERDLLTNRARVANNEIRRAKNNAAIFFQNYTPEDLQETMTLNSEIRRQVDNIPSFKTSEAKSAAIQSVKDSVARLQQIESKYDSQKKQQVQGAVQEGAQPGGVPVEGAGTAETAPGGVLQDVSQTQQEQVAQQRTEEASALNVKPRLKRMKVTAANAPGAYSMMMNALSNYTDEFLAQNKTTRADVERGIKSLFDVISSLDSKGRSVEIDVMGTIDEANKLFGFKINEVDGKFEVSSKIPGANRVFDTKEGADAYTKRVLYRGVNMMSDGGDVKISVLLPAMLDNTGYHEALHSLEVLDEDSVGKLVKGLKDALKKLPVLDKRMADFVKDYGDKLKDSEFLAELGSMISTGDISVEVRESVIKTIAKSFLDFFKRVTGSSVDTSPTAEQLARTFNDIAEKLGRGEKQPPYRKTRKKGEESGAVDRAKVRFQGIESEISNLPTNEQKRAKELFQLIGENAELTQDVRNNLQVARYMEDDGKDVENIRMATGWERGKDGMWRYEIQDLEFKKKIGRFEEDLNQVIKSAKNGNLEQYDLNELIDSDLFYFYPSLNNTSVILSRRLVVGFQDVLGGAEGSYYKEGKRGIIAIKAKEDLTIEKLRLILVHEIQHAIQDIENFAKGNYGVSMQDEVAAEKEIKLLDNKIGVSTQIIRDGNDSFLSENINELSDSEKSAYKEILDYSKSASMPILDAAKVWDKIWKKDKDTQKNILKQNERYVKTAGEVESRNVEARIGMTPEQRREITLEKTEDVSRAEQIVFFDNSYGQAFQSIEASQPKFQLSGMSTNKFTDYLSTKYGVNLDIVGSLGKDGITLSRIIVPKENRKSGIGSSIMNEIIDYADANNERILLTPSDSFGGNVERLKKFYKNLGFIENKGRNRDFTTKESMYRNPVPKAASNFKGLSKRLSGDALLNAQDLSNELLDNGAKIDADGLVTVYHRTTDDKKAQIEQSGIMLGLEDGLFFSTKESGQAEGYGDAVIQLRIPIEKLQLDDTFGDEAHVRIPTSKPRQSVDVSAYLTQPKFQRAASDEISMDDFAALSKRLNKFFKGNVKIVDADTFEKESEKFTGEKLDLKSYDGNVYGAVLPNGVMFINGLDVNSLLHEHTHLFNQVVMKVNPQLWNSIKEAVKKTAEWSQVKRNPLYSNLKTDDEVADEVFSKIVGNAAKNGWQKYTNQSIYQNIKALAQKFYNTILDLFGVDYYKGMSASGLADLTLTELMGGVSTLPYQIDAKINELMSELFKGIKYLDQLRFNIDPNSRKKFEKALGEKDGRALYEIFGNVQDPSKLIDFAKSKFPIKGTLSSIAKRPIKDDSGFVINNGNFGSIVVYKDYEKYLNKELKQVVDKATLDPQDLLNEVGYTLFNPRNLSDARNSFLHYYKKGHNICTLNPGSDRFSGSFVTFIVRNDADQTPSAEDLTQDNLTDEWRKYLEKNGRKNSDGTYNLNGLKPNALDPYSTSVISLQINKSNGSTKEISRYNHQISSPDNIFSRNFDNLIEGLSDAMFKKFGVEKNTKQSTTRMPNGVIQDANGAYYNYIYETNGVYYGDGYYLENGVATLLDRGSERMVDGWVISNRGDGTATNIDRTTRGFLYGDVKKVNYIRGDEISLTTENGNFVFEVKNGAVVRLIDFPKKWRLDKLNDFYAGFRTSLEYDKNGNLILPELHFTGYINMLWADDIIGFSSSVEFESTKIQYLGNLQYIKGDANFSGSQVKSLGELKYIGDDARFDDSQVQSLGKLKYIGGNAVFRDSQIQSLGELKYIKGGASFRSSQVQSLGGLKYIGGSATFTGSQVQSLGELKYIGDDVDFIDSQVHSLGKLKYISGYADFSNSQVKSLGELKYIGSGANFSNSQVQSLGELKYIGGNAYYYNSPIDSKAIEDIEGKSNDSTREIILRDANDFKESIEREFEQFAKEIKEEFTESQPKFQTPIDEAFDRQQTFIDDMSKKRGVLRNLNPRLLDRASPLKKKLIDANLKNARDLFVAQAGAGSRAKMFIDENFGSIYNGLNKQNTEYLDKIIQLRRIIQIDEDFDSKGKPRIKHTADKYNSPINKEVAEKNLVDFGSILGSALYNDLIRRSELYFDSYKKLLSIMRESGLITQELYDSLKSLLYQPRKFLDQFVSFDDGETVIDIKDLALNEYQIKTLQNGSDSEIMMNSKLLLAFSAKSVFSRAARNKTYTAISEATKDPNNNGWISDKELKNFEPVNYFVDGVRKQFFIRGDFKKQLYDSTRHLISPAAANIIRVLSGSAVLKSFATQVNPLFALKNFPRDILHVAMFTNAYGNNLYSSIFRISRDAFKGMHDKMSKSADFKEWLDYGGGMDFLSTEGFESRSIRDGVYTKVRDALSTFGEYSEVGVRLAVYKKTRDELVDKFIKDNGRTPNKDESDSIKTEAAVASREIIDFAQGGSWAKAGENFIPYLNAAIQGFRVAINYIVKNPKNFAVKASQLALAVGMIMFYNSLMADDDDWEGISDGEKMRNFIIFLPFKDKDGNRYYLKIAKTQQAILFSTMFEIASAKILNEVMNPDGDDKVAKKYMMYGDRNYNAVRDGITSFLPKNPLEVKKELTSAIPLINAISAIDNHDTFFNSKVSYDYQKMPAMYEDVLDPDVPYFYKALSQSMYPVIQLGPKRMETAVGKITTGAETSIIVAGAYHLLDNISRKVADVKTDELNIGEVPSDNPKLRAISSLFSPLKGVVKSVNPGIKKYQYEDDLNSISLRGGATVETIKNASRNLGEKYYDAVRGEGDLTKDEVISQVNEYKDMLLKSGVQPSQVKVFIESFKMSAKSNPKTSWEAGYYDIMYSPSSEATVGIISKLKGSNLTDDELKEYFINYKKSTGYKIKNVGEVYSLYRKSRDKK